MMKTNYQTKEILIISTLIILALVGITSLPNSDVSITSMAILDTTVPLIENQTEIYQDINVETNNVTTQIPMPNEKRADKTKQTQNKSTQNLISSLMQLSNPSKPDNRFKIKGLNKIFKLYQSGTEIINQDFVGLHEFILEKGQNKISKFYLKFNKDMDLSDLIADTNISESKAYLHRYNQDIKDISLYIPRQPGQYQARICANASSFDEIYQGCSKEPTVTEEYVLTLYDPRLSITPDGKYFIVANITGTGGQGENNSLINITIISPINNSGSNNNRFTIHFNITAITNISSCSLILNNTITKTNNSISLSETNSITSNSIGPATYPWKINCTDINNNTKNTMTYYTTIIPTTNYSGLTTDLSTVNINNITDFTIEDPSYGRVIFNEPVDLTNGADINTYTSIANNYLTIESYAIPSLNVSAAITLYNILLQNPVVLRDGIPCTDCAFISYNGNFTFSVPHFSSYTASENSQLEIWDDSDLSLNQPGKFNFYANYTNTTDGQPITEISCTITFEDSGSASMTYNSTMGLFIYNKTMTTGITDYNISCDGTSKGYTALNTTDSATASIINGPSAPTNITVGLSQRGNLSNTTKTVEANPGGIAHLNMGTSGTITQSWQGYYRSIFGTITLSDAQDKRFYNWNVTSPQGQVYATRAIDADFSTIQCMDASGMQAEHEFIGNGIEDIDSIGKTFGKKSHPEFTVATITIEQDSCNSTNTYVNGGTQTDDFYEVLLTDANSNTIYAALIDSNKEGFNGHPQDFQMLVGEDSHNGDNEATLYYFFIEMS